MSNNSFWAQYRDPRWQRKRLEVMEEDDFKCACCGSQDKSLNVHHITYPKGRPIWEAIGLVTLCEDCHRIQHHVIDELKSAISRCDKESLKLLLEVSSLIDVDDTEALDAIRMAIDAVRAKQRAEYNRIKLNEVEDVF